MVKIQYLETPIYLADTEKYFLQLIKPYQNLCVVVDTNTALFCLPVFKKKYCAQLNLIFVTIESGEQNKTLENCQIVWQHLLQSNFTKNTLLVALGGGIVSDITGFVASTYKRGVDVAFFPTTLLSMVDAAIGGKNGVNYQLHKNMIGTFLQPKAIFIDEIFLNTLNPFELKNGYAESLKHGLIADVNFFNELNFSNSSNKKNIENSIQIKTQFVNADEHEKEVRKALNAGHTVAHALETYSLQNKRGNLSHGFAVVFGLFCESFIARYMNLLPEEEFNIIHTKLKTDFPIYVIPENHVEEIITYMLNDKKNDAQIRFSLLQGIGNVSLDIAVEKSVIASSIKYFINNY